MKSNNNRFSVVYVRVSSKAQTTHSQTPDLKRYVESHADELGTVRILIEKHSGQTMDRPKWNKIEKAIVANRVSNLVIWRLDRLGRTCSGLTKLFETLQAHRTNLISVHDNLDLSTVTGRLIAHVLASVAAYENEVRTERIIAGQQAAKAAGKSIGGSKKGSLYKITLQQVKAIVKLKAAGKGATEISKTVNTSVPNVYRILKRVKDGDIVVE